MRGLLFTDGQWLQAAFRVVSDPVRYQILESKAYEMSDVAGLRLLVVEDEMLIAMTIEDLLSDLGCTVVGPASSVAKALEIVNTHEIDGAILDLNLKGEQAIPVAEALRTRGTPFFFLTGYGTAAASHNQFGVPTLPKPFDPAMLQQLIEETMLPRRPVKPA